MIRESDAAYIAGLFDGEGSIEFTKRKEKKRNGMPVITVNGSYEYCIKNGVTPSAMVMLDAREF